jgi:hypothetical protein
LAHQSQGAQNDDCETKEANEFEFHREREAGVFAIDLFLIRAGYYKPRNESKAVLANSALPEKRNCGWQVSLRRTIIGLSMLHFRAWSRWPVLFAVIGLLLVIVPYCRAQDAAKRLILKDGSYQLVAKYEVHGDRVRYMSAERNEWEELPSDLVDWPATEKFEKERATPVIPEAKAIDQETDAERDAEVAQLPEVAPGLRLPEDTGVYMLDNYAGQPQLVEMQQAEGDVNPDNRANILRGVLGPAASAKGTIELDGARAAIHAHVAVPSIYLNVVDEAPQPPPGETASANMQQPSLDAPRAQQPQQPVQAVVPFDRFRIVTVKVKNGKRIVGDVKRNAAGKVTQDETYVKTTVDRIKGGWLKLTPTSDLAPGEYAVVEGSGEGMDLYIWDFGVDPKAPENKNPYKPAVKEGPKTAEKPADVSK